MFVFVTACGTDEKSNADETAKDAKKEEDSSESIDVDKNLLSVEITLPASMFEGEDAESSIAEAEAEGIQVTKNADGSVTYKMSKAKHKEMMREMETELQKSIEEMKNGKDSPSIKEVTANKSYSEFTLEVDRAGYENSFDGFAVFGLGLSGMYYQLFQGKDSENIKVKIIVKDVATGEVIGETVYPDALEDLESEEAQE